MSSHRSPYQRTVAELRDRAALFWPAELSAREAEASVIPLLLATQQQFISILSVAPVDLASFFRIIDASELSANLFLKHLVVLTDFSGESLQRVGRESARLFPDGHLRYTWRSQPHAYRFQAIPGRALDNRHLGLDGPALLRRAPLSPLQQDAVALLLFGAAAGDAGPLADLQKCDIGALLGRPDELATFLKQRYIWVSRITGGARANALGQLAQQRVAEHLAACLPGLTVHPGGRLPGVTQTTAQTGRDTAFDIIVTDGRRYAAVEVSFQVTTNSTIERKAGQARDRFTQIEAAGHRIAYVLDGAGNFQRESALAVICAHSHCTVAFTAPELDLLCAYLRATFAAP